MLKSKFNNRVVFHLIAYGVTLFAGGRVWGQEYPLNVEFKNGSHILEKNKHNMKRVFDLPLINLSFLGGKSTLTDGDFGEKESGYGYRIGFKYYFQNDNPRSSRFFAGISYDNSLGSEYKRLVFDLGLTTKILWGKSYIYGLVGIGGLKRSPASKRSLENTETILRLAAGYVFRITPRVGLEFYGGLDAIYLGEKEDFPGDPVTTPKIDEGLIDLKLGVTIGL